MEISSYINYILMGLYKSTGKWDTLEREGEGNHKIGLDEECFSGLFDLIRPDPIVDQKMFKAGHVMRLDCNVVRV